MSQCNGIELLRTSQEVLQRVQQENAAASVIGLAARCVSMLVSVQKELNFSILSFNTFVKLYYTELIQ